MLSFLKTKPDITAISYSKHEKICGILLAIIAIDSSLAIMNGAEHLISSSLAPFRAAPNYVATLLLLYYIPRAPKYHKMNLSLLIAWVFNWILSTFHLYPGAKVEITWLFLLIIILFCYNNARIVHYGFRIFRLYLIAVSFIGIFAYLFYVTNLIPPLRITNYYSDNVNSLYIVYPLAYLVQDGISIRLSCLFHEPSDIGMFAIFTLISERFNLRNKGNLVLFIAGLLSFSFGFYVIFLIYFLYRGYRNYKWLAGIAMAVIVFVFAIKPYISKNSDIGLLIDRFSYDKSEGRFAGDNRNNEAFDNWYDYVKSRGNLVFGIGAGYRSFVDNTVTSSYKNTLVEHGYVGAIAMWGLLFWAVYRYAPRKRETMIYILCVFLTLYYSPNIFKVAKLLCLFGGMTSLACMGVNEWKLPTIKRSVKKRRKTYC